MQTTYSLHMVVLSVRFVLNILSYWSKSSRLPRAGLTCLGKTKIFVSSAFVRVTPLKERLEGIPNLIGSKWPRGHLSALLKTQEVEFDR